MHPKRLLFFFLLFLLKPFISWGQLSVSAVGTNGKCTADASITATVSGNNGDPVSYELLKSGSVIRAYSASPVFNNLSAGTYVVQVIDLTTLATAQSSNTTLTTSYVTLNIKATNTVPEGCFGAYNGVLTATVTGGNKPYTYSLSGTKTVASQSSNVFTGLTSGPYNITVTDSCGNSRVITTAVSLEPNTVTTLGVKWGGGYITYQSPFNCNSPLTVNFWGILNSYGTALTTHEKSIYRWAYEYPSGSGNIYGAGGALGGQTVPLTQTSLPLTPTATYPYQYADLILFDSCGNAKFFKKAILPSIPQPGPGVTGDIFSTNLQPIYDCTYGAGAHYTLWGDEAICYPFTFAFTDKATGKVVYDTIANSSSSTSLFGLTPGDTYTVVSKDGNGHRANWYTSDTLKMLTTQAGFSVLTDTSTTIGANAGTVRIYPTGNLVTGSQVTYQVTASTNPAVPVGYSKTVTTTYPLDPQFSALFLTSPNNTTSWPEGTYTVNITGGCYSSTNTFTIIGFNAKLNGVYTTNPTCGSFGLNVQASIPNDPSNSLDQAGNYVVTILSGPSNIGQQAHFSTIPVSPGVYSAFFPGLTYGTYTVGLGIAGSNTSSFGTENITYTVNNTFRISASKTGGYVCSGQTTGTLTISAVSAISTTLQYSIDAGKTYQTSNIFPNVAVGTYPVQIMDSCGDVATYKADVRAANNIYISSSSTNDTICNGTSFNLYAAVGDGITYAWTGPNGFTSSLQSPTVTKATSAASGTYSVTITTPSCTLTGSVKMVINPYPSLVVNNPSPVCYPGTVDITKPAITSGSGPGLSLGYYVDSLGAQTLSKPNAIGISGTYYIKGTNSNGCTVFKPVVVTIITPPIATISYVGSPYCGPIMIPVVQTGQTGGTYSSTPGLSINPSTGTINVGASAVGNYTITYTFTNGSCSNTTTTNITINTPTVYNVTGTTTICTGSSANIGLDGSDLNVNYQLQVGGVNVGKSIVGTGSALSWTVTSPGTYTVVATNSSYTCNVNMNGSAVITVIPLPTASNAGNNINLNCATQTSTSLSGNNPSNGTGTWTQVTGPNTASITNPTAYNSGITGLISGTYTFKWTISNGVCSSSSTVNVTIPPVLSASIKTQTNVTCNGGLNGSVTAAGSGGTPPYIYSWNTNPVQTGATANGLGVGDYIVTVTDAAGCITTAPVTITQPAAVSVVVTNPATVYAPNVVDITSPGITTGSTFGLTYTYFTDLAATQPLSNPTKINQSGTFYIKGTNGLGCIGISAVQVKIIPVATPDFVSTASNTAVTSTVLSNDFGNLNPASVTIGTNPSHGTVLVNPDGSITYTPTPGFSGTDLYTYSVCDQALPSPTCSNFALVTVTVANPILPIPIADKMSTVSNSPITLPNISSNDIPGTYPIDPSSIDLDTTQVGVQSSYTVAGQGTFMVNSTGAVLFTPASGFSGIVTDRYTIADIYGYRSSISAPITLSVYPVANPDSAATASNAPTTTNVLLNDIGNLNPASVTISSNPSHGTVLVYPNGTITYTPTPGYSGSDTYTYTVCDKTSPSPLCSAPALVKITTGNPILPIPVSDQGITIAQKAITLANISSNDIAGTYAISPGSIDLDTLTAGVQSTYTLANQGTFSVDASGALTFTPATGFSGIVTDSYTIADIYGYRSVKKASITIYVYPTYITNPLPVTDYLNTPVITNLLTNNIGNLDPTTIKIESAPTHGLALVNGDGTVTYTPLNGYIGADSYIYTVCDKTKPSPLCSTPVTVQINVLPPKADISVVLTGPSSQNDANPVKYTLKVTDLGPTNSHKLVMTNTLPGGVKLIDSTLKYSGGTVTYNASTNTLTLTVDSLPIGQSITITYSIIPSKLGTLTNSASVTGFEPDPVLTNNISTVTTDYELNNLIITNLFTPTGSSKNEVFEIKGLEYYPNNTMDIFNRWGNSVYHTESYGTGGNWWNGSGVNDGTYYYLLKINNNGTSLVKSGYVTIMRKAKH